MNANNNTTRLAKKNCVNGITSIPNCIIEIAFANENKGIPKLPYARFFSSKILDDI
jgi:hypothetical protein